MLLYTADDEAAEIEQFGRLVDGADVDAFVLTSTHHGDTRIDWLIEHEVPFVTFGRPWGVADMTDPEHLWVDVDGRHGLSLATEHVLAGGRAPHRVPRLAGRVGHRRRPPRGLARDDGGAHRPDGGRARGPRPDRGRGSDRQLDRDAPRRGARPDARRDRLRERLARARGPARARRPASRSSATTTPRSPGRSALCSIEQQLDEVAEGVLDLLIGAHRGKAGGTDGVDDPQHRLVKPRLVVR